MFFSIILATLNRNKEIQECLKSLLNQKCKDFEVIVIDQSEDCLTQNVVEQFSMIKIQYYNVGFKGLSKARNFGLKYARGKFCCLMDDDAIYSPEYLSTAKKLIEKYGEVVLSGIILSSDDRKTPFIKYSGLENHCKMKVRNIIDSCPSAALVFPTRAVHLCGGVEERLGVGNLYSSSEETDFLLRLFDYGFTIRFSNEMILYHPIKPILSMRSVYNHYLGKGALFKIDLLQRKKTRLIYLLLKNTIGMFLKAYILDSNNKELYITRRKGFVEGIRNFEVLGKERKKY